MSNTDFDFAPEDFIQRRAQAVVATSVDADPEKASRALQIADATGMPAPVVYDNFDNFEAQYRNGLSSEIVKGNPHLQAWIAANPLAAKVANDDFGQLDLIGNRAKAFRPDTILGEAITGFKENFDYDSMEAEHGRYVQWLASNPLFGNLFIRHAAEATGTVLAGSQRLFSGVIGGAARGAAELYKQSGGSEAMANRLTRDLIIGAQVGLSGQAGLHGLVPPEVHGMISEAAQAAKAAAPYIAAGKEPPVGVHPILDSIKVEQAKIDLDNLKEALRESAKSATRERAPDLYANYIGRMVEGEIGISADAVRKLYGEKLPEPDDGKLGWVPDLQAQLEHAEAVGGDVKVPLADYLARVEPDVAKELQDHIRFRPEGMTIEETKAPPGIEVYHGSPYEFEAFDTGKIGTGEGAQSYGYGHYFAEHPDVAIEYQRSIRGEQSLGELRASHAIENNAGDRAAAIAELESDAKRFTKGSPQANEIVEGLRFLRNDKWSPPRGNLYRARILRHPDEFLDWDRPLGEQPEILAKLKPVLDELREDTEGVFSEEGKQKLERPELLTGADVRNLLDTFFDSRTGESTSRALAEAGIPGIKYLDQMSRPAVNFSVERYKDRIKELEEELTNVQARWGNQASFRKPQLEESLALAKEQLQRLENPTRNFVVFNDRDIQITHVNGEARAIRQAAGLEPKEVRVEGAPEPKAPEPLDERAAFAKASAIGMTVDQYKRYQKLIERRAEQDAKALEERALRYQRKTQTDEWKAARAELRPEVEGEIASQPAHELDEMLRGGKIKIDPEGLSDDLRAALPKDYLAKDGVHPDDLAGLFGHDSGSSVVGELVNMLQTRDAAGMKPRAFFNRLVDLETDRRMRLRFGDLDKNIIEEAKDQVLSAVQEDMLHEEVMALAQKAGAEFSIGKEEVRAWVKERVDQTPIRSISTDRFLADAGRAGRAAELALLKGDAAEAFRQKQRQFLAFTSATMAKKIERAREAFDKTAKRFSARELSGVEQEYTNWVHDILGRVGKPVKRSVQDLAEALERGEQKTLKDFVEYKESHDLREVPVADFLMDPAWRKKYEDLTAEEFAGVHGSVKALAKNGADERKIIKAGEAADLAEVKGKMIEAIRQFKEKEYTTEGKRAQFAEPVRRLFRSALVAHLQVEAVFNRLDRFDKNGVWNQYVFRELAQAANHSAKLEREFAAKLGAIADNADLRERISNPIFSEPFSKSAEFPTGSRTLQFTRKNLRAVLLNAGNESNLFKLAKGYNTEPEIVRMWLNQHATKADWDWAQKVWDMLEDLHQLSNTMYRGLTGIEPESLVIKPIQTPHGEYRGGYYPLIRHPTFGTDVKLFKTGLEGENYVRATTPAGYTKKRTGAIYPLSLDLDSLPNQIKGIIHDVAFRPAVVQAGKIFYDKTIHTEMVKHLGKEYADMFVPWLRDVANTANYISPVAKEFGWWSDFARQNAITTLVGLNPGTFMKHTPTALISSMAEVGPVKFMDAMKSLTSINERTGETNWQFAMKTSEELQRRVRNWIETMGGGQAVLEGRTVGKALAQGEYGAAFMSLRETVTQLASKPVAMGDLLSAVPTWMARYKEEMLDHGVHGDAVYAADKAVRQAHGSSAITSRSQVARSRSALVHWMTGFFTFFNDLMNRQVETVWRAGLALDLAKEGQHAEAMAQVPKIAGRLFAYVVAPAMIEELVSPLASEDKESWGKKAAKMLAFTLSSSWVGARDIVSGMLNGRDPSAGLISTFLKSGADVARDLTAKRVKPENVIKHGTQLGGMLTGLTPAQVGRVAAFGYGVETGQERPKGPWAWLVGARYGTTQKHSRTFDEYLKNLRGH